MSLKWSDITMKDGIMVIKTLGKGNKWDEKKLSDGLYLELMEFKKTVGDREKIFTLAKGTIDKMKISISETETLHFIVSKNQALKKSLG